MKQKDKAKAYDEVLTKAAALYKASEPMSGCNVILETLFPELKESEDERIKEEIIEQINLLKSATLSDLRDKQFNSWIAWLEKQGKQEKDILEDAILDGNEDGLIAETIRYKNEKQSKQKPVWSEEDERLCQCLIEDQKEALDKVRNNMYGHSEIISDLMEMYHERIDWLKSLKSKVQPQNTK